MTSRAPEHSTIPEESESEARTKATSSVGQAETEPGTGDVEGEQGGTEGNVVVEVENSESAETESNKQGGLWYKDGNKQTADENNSSDNKAGDHQEGVERGNETEGENLNTNNNNNEQDGEGEKKEENTGENADAESGIYNQILC